MLGSFKIKLVGTFLALSVVPLAAAFWGFSAVAERSVTSSVDDRLEAGLNAAPGGLRGRAPERRALPRSGSGRDPEFQAALARRDRAALRRLLPKSPPLRVETPDGFAVGRVPRERGRDDCGSRRPGQPVGDDHRLGPADAAARPAAARPFRAHRSRTSSPSSTRSDTSAPPRSPDVTRHDAARAGAGREHVDRRARLPRDRVAARAGEHADARRGHAQLGDRVGEAERARPPAASG